MKESLKKTIRKILDLISTPAVRASGAKTLSANTNNTMCSAALLANRCYLVLLYGAIDTGQHTENISAYVAAGTYSEWRLYQGKGVSNSGGGVVGFGFIKTTSQITLSAQMYGYVSAPANATILAVPILGGVVRNLLKALQSLPYRKAVIA